MARTPAQRGKIGNWLLERRMARSWPTQERARDEIERLTGWRIPQSVYAEWESGRRVPSEANLARLEEFYGAPATSGPQAAESAQVAELLTLVRSLLGELEAERDERREWERGFLDAMRELATGAAPRADPARELPGGRPGH